MRYFVMLCSVGIGVVMALNVEAGSPASEQGVSVAEKAKIVAAAEAALAAAPKSVCREGFVYIPAGDFVMGSEYGWADERPVRKIGMDAYCMAKSETTNAGYLKVIPGTREDGGKKFNSPNQPVINVNWKEADAYCKALGGRLPTEAEWEKAAWGPKGLEFGTQSGRLKKDEANIESDTTKAVCSFPMNGYGLCDMIGNVWEWTNDWYAKDAYQKMGFSNPQGPRRGVNKVVRGGSYSSDEICLRANNRSESNPDQSGDSYGFRCVVPVLNTAK